MEYREIGKTGMRAGVVGLGAEHLVGLPYAQVEETIHAALDGGMNIMDLFMPQEQVRRDIGRALGSRRKDMIIQGHIGSVVENDQPGISRDPAVCQKYFEDLLSQLGTDYIDLGMMFYIDTDEAFTSMFEGPVLEYALKLKQQGVIRALGASSHNPRTARRVVETGLVDVVMFSINPAFDMIPADKEVFSLYNDDFDPGSLVTMDPERADFYRLCSQRDVSITVMKTLGSGKLLSAEQTPFAQAMSVGQCIHYALNRPGVASALVGCTNAAQIGQALAYLDMSDDRRDYAQAIRAGKNDFTGACVYCNHCLPCPVHIDVAAVHKYLDIALLDEDHIPDTIAHHYRALTATAGQCIACGSCEGQCPFSVPVIENMKKAQRVFGA